MGSYQGQDMLELRRGAKGPCFWLLAPALLAGLSLLSCKHSPAHRICYNVLYATVAVITLSLALAPCWHLTRRPCPAI